MAPLEGGERTLVVIELLAAEHDAATKTVVYRVTLLAEAECAVRAAATPLAAPPEEQRFGPGHLFVDDPAPATICLTPPNCPR